MKISKTLVITKNCFPPVLVGPAILLSNLFRQFDSDSYCVLMENPNEGYRLLDESSRLSCKYYYVKYPNRALPGWKRFRTLLEDFKHTVKIAWIGRQIIKREGVKTIFAVPYYLEAMAALMMKWLTGRRLVVYLPDIFYVKTRFGQGWSSFMMRLLEPILLRCANMVLVTAEPTREYYKKKYNIDTTILPHTVDQNWYSKSTGEFKHNKSDKLKIVFTGEVSEAQIDAILNMVEVANSSKEPKINFIVAANASSDIIESMGVKGPAVTVTSVCRKEIPALQQSADILFLPLSFVWSKDVIKTASPSKLPEYLASGRPIIVYAPEYSYIARYAREHSFALVVDESCCEKLKAAVVAISSNEMFRRDIVYNAVITSEKHDAAVVLQQFASYLG